MWAQAFARLLRGVPVAEVAGLMEECRPALLRRIRPIIMREVRARRSDGCRILLASTSIAPLVEAVGAVAGADSGLGSPLEVKNGHYTGELAGPICFAAQKLHYVERLLGTRWPQIEVDWGASYAYSDSLSDLPMLERVGEPVAVWPNPSLARVAGERGWRTLTVERVEASHSSPQVPS